VFRRILRLRSQRGSTPATVRERLDCALSTPFGTITKIMKKGVLLHWVSLILYYLVKLWYRNIQLLKLYKKGGENPLFTNPVFEEDRLLRK